jgi:trehalose/maltose transport system permease protein
VSTVAERAAKPQASAAGRLRRLRRSPAGRFVRRLPFYLLITVIFLYALFPFYWALRSAFTPDADLFKTPVQYFPANPTLHQFREVLSSHFFLRALLNSTLVAGSVTLLALVLGSFAGFALGRFRFRGRSVMLYLMLSMTIFPQIAILGALYTMITGLHVDLLGLSVHFPHLYDTLWALIFSYMIFTLPLTVWVLTSFMRALPVDLEEAAYIDGASPLQVFYRVLLPLVAPGLVTTGLLAFIAAWNEFLYALSFEQKPEHYTVNLAIVNFVGKTGSAFQVPWGQIMAATVVVTVPLIVLTLLLQRRILAGLTAGAVKG